MQQAVEGKKNKILFKIWPSVRSSKSGKNTAVKVSLWQLSTWQSRLQCIEGKGNRKRGGKPRDGSSTLMWKREKWNFYFRLHVKIRGCDVRVVSISSTWVEFIQSREAFGEFWRIVAIGFWDFPLTCFKLVIACSLWYCVGTRRLVAAEASSSEGVPASQFHFHIQV